eukprot:Hpha_TRINITY_DN16203_c0_g1::TRINITY_DN16203_c0_g1_i1::g.11490::m.11490
MIPPCLVRWGRFIHGLPSPSSPPLLQKQELPSNGARGIEDGSSTLPNGALPDGLIIHRSKSAHGTGTAPTAHPVAAAALSHISPDPLLNCSIVARRRPLHRSSSHASWERTRDQSSPAVRHHSFREATGAIDHLWTEDVNRASAAVWRRWRLRKESKGSHAAVTRSGPGGESTGMQNTGDLACAQ